MSRIFLVDDETMLLDSLEIILSLNDHEIVGKAHDGVEALEKLSSVSPDLALVDLNMKGMGGIELIGEMKRLYPDVKILVLTTFYDDRNITDAIGRGADGYLLKDSGKDAILGAVRQILGGGAVLDAKVMQRLTALVTGGSPEYGGQSAADGGQTGAEGNRNTDVGKDSFRSGVSSVENAADPLTEREKEICALMVEGLTNRQIADRLYISEGTVKNYISNIYDKTGIHDRVKLTIALRS
ncbi:MAG: response regulator transcription factor [Eubacterium sp.]|nr:response regulator transcription factor [Eubacterium sp.]